MVRREIMLRFYAGFGARPQQLTRFVAGSEDVHVASDSKYVYLLGSQGTRLVMPRTALKHVLAPIEKGWEWRCVIEYIGGDPEPSIWTTREGAEKNLRFRRSVGAPIYGPGWLERRLVGEVERVDDYAKETA
jgi:hypothetical protein